MFMLIVLSLLLVFICAWFLSRPFRINRSEQEARAQQGQYVLARERLLQQLEQIDVQAAEGLLEQESASNEVARLEYELAGILERIDAGSVLAGQTAKSNETVLHGWLAWTGFSLSLLIGSFTLYGLWQGNTLLGPVRTDGQQRATTMTARSQSAPISVVEPSSTTVPPEALAMVARLEGKLKDNPNDGEGWKRLGRSYMVMGRYRDAVSAYSSAAELLPDDPQVKEVIQQLAEIAGQGGRHPQEAATQQAQIPQPAMQEGLAERISQLKEHVAANPDEAMGWARLGRAYLSSQQQDDAERAYARAYALEPENIVILSSYAGIIFSKNHRDPEGKALDLYTKLYALNPEHPDGLWFLGLAAYSRGDFSRSVELWTKLLSILPPETEGYASVQSALGEVQALSMKDK